ncbi:MAG: peptidoglycan DD-metalloendopeptidase family protein [Gammaproteobacteria bacterium]|nr:peptidoglycan DD-metalloendopeptidase family protein [Gammaproteobacteria bacterium]
MNIIFVGKFRGKPLRYHLNASRPLITFIVIISLFGGSIASAGYWYGKKSVAVHEFAELEQNLSEQKVLINEARRSAESELDAVAARLGKMQANVIRLNALGQRLVKVAKLDSKEFNFKNNPSYGGPSENDSVASVDFANIMADLDKQLSSREEQLGVLEEVIMNRQLRSESKPRGRPIVKGWTSSYYGKRTDPFTGKLAMHKGMDFAGKEGSEIIAVASGVVTWAGERYGYGQLVEINHGNGYTTRYGHNAEILVEVGDSVEKGQTISLMGSTGRSTGPHVHFEVLKNDRQVNPSHYVALQ